MLAILNGWHELNLQAHDTVLVDRPRHRDPAWLRVDREVSAVLDRDPGCGQCQDLTLPTSDRSPAGMWPRLQHAYGSLRAVVSR